jgi:hypothetical protein
MSDYATIEQVSKFLQGSEEADTDALALSITAASRFIDNLCEVTPSYFAAAVEGSEATEIMLKGTGTSLLRLPPYVPGSLAALSLDGQSLDLTPFALRGSVPLQFLIAPGRIYFGEDTLYTVSARWGFEVIPADIVQATIAMAIKFFRESDAATAVMAGTENQTVQIVPPMVEKICEAYRKMNLYLTVI